MANNPTVVQPYVAGPAHIYTGTVASGSFSTIPGFEYLGMCEDRVRITSRFHNRPFHNSMSGDGVEFDRLLMGYTCVVSGILNTYNEQVLNKIRNNFYNFVSGPPVEGAIPAGAIGGFKILAGYSFPVCILQPYASQAQYSVTGQQMNALYYFPYCSFENDLIEDLYCGPKTEQFALVANGLFNNNGACFPYQRTLPVGVTLPPVQVNP